MLVLPRSVRIFLSTQPTDMRCGFDKLGAFVQAMGMDVYSGHLFAFASRRGDRIKLLAFDHGGFVLWYKRLERGRFKLPKCQPDQATVNLDGPSLAMLLDGIDYAQVRRPPHWRPKVTVGDRHGATDVIEPTVDVERGIRRIGAQPAADLAAPASDGRGAANRLGEA